MLIGIISDIHGNTEALRAVIAEMPDVDTLLVAGDIAGRAANLLELFELIDTKNCIFIKGNHEEMAVLYYENFGRDEKLGGLIQRIKDAPYEAEVSLGGKKILLTHGSPKDPKNEYIYPEYPDFDKFDDLGFDYIVLGHTHIPMIVRLKHTTIINPGSVGEPQASDPRPSFAVVDTETGKAEIHYLENYVEKKRLRYINPFRWGRYNVRRTKRENIGPDGEGNGRKIELL